MRRRPRRLFISSKVTTMKCEATSCLPHLGDYMFDEDGTDDPSFDEDFV